MKDRRTLPLRDHALEMLMEDVMKGLRDYVLAAAAAGTSRAESAEIVSFDEARRRLAASRAGRR